MVIKPQNSIETCLYIVPTPIGNLKEITLRAIEILSNVDIIATEDTRRAGLLLKLLNIQHKEKLQSYYNFNEEEKSFELVKLIQKGFSVALISDAGTPCISDPGYRLVKKARENNIKIISLPGATAFVPALVSSGFSNHCFTFWGFPPQKRGRQSFLKKIINNENTSILYESSHRIRKLISEIAEFDINRNIYISREISKIYEEHILFNTQKFLNGEIKIIEKGEFVIIIEGKIWK